MHVITRTRLAAFWAVHPPTETLLKAWETAVKGASWTCSADVKRTFRNADWVPDFWVFDVNSNRVICYVHYCKQREDGSWIGGTVYIREVFTHDEYDKWSAKQGKK